MGSCLTTWLVAAIAALAPGDDAKISAATRDEQGVRAHEVESPYQAGKTQIRLLPPDTLKTDQGYPVIYILPVEAGREAGFGDSLAEVKKLDLHNRHQAIFVAPTFSHLPWYADHPREPTIRQESYFLKVVVPYVERTYPATARPEGRLLLGFSKSGWGAWSLLLRQPELFGRAAAWDAPLMMDRLGKYGTPEIFGSQENFERYRLADLLRARAEQVRTGPRLILTGYGNFRPDHEQTHKLLDELKIGHVYRDGPQRKHDWHSGWVGEAVELLLATTSDK